MAACCALHAEEIASWVTRHHGARHAAAPEPDRTLFHRLNLVGHEAFQSGRSRPAARLAAGAAARAEPVAVGDNASFRWCPKGVATAAGVVAAVVVPVCLRNDAFGVPALAALLRALSQQSAVARLAFALVDDGSPLGEWWQHDALRGPLADLTAAAPGRLAVLRRLSNGGAAAARDDGLRLAGEAGLPFAILTDADCVPDACWALEHLTCLEARQNAGPKKKKQDQVCVRRANLGMGLPSDGSPFGWVSATRHHQACGCAAILSGVTRAIGSDNVSRWHDAWGHLNARRLADGRVVYGPTCNLSLRLDALHRLPDGSFLDRTFPGASYEDVELCIRNLDRGNKIFVAARATLAHRFAGAGSDAGACEEPESALRRRFERYGASEHLLFERHPAWSHEALYVATRASSLAELALAARRGGCW